MNVLRGLGWVMVACAPRAPERPAALPERAATVEAVEAAVNQAHIHYDGDDRDAVLGRLAQAIERYAASPPAHGGMLTFTSLAAHSQGHWMSLSWEETPTPCLRVHTYPVENASWEATFCVDARGHILDMVVATIEPDPGPEAWADEPP